MIQKFPFKKHLDLQWYEAAIGQFLFFKNLKDKYNDSIYFHLSQNGITLKANNAELLNRAEQQLNKIYNNSKIQMLDVSYSSSFYQRIIQDIKAYTLKLKDSKDCPYINLVYSQKIRQTCLMMKKFKYGYPYQRWEEEERNNKGFAYLIVRPDYRWSQIQIAVYNMINKRQSSIVRNSPQPKIWFIELPLQKFIWIYLKKQFKQYKEMIDIKERKNENTICIGVNTQLPILNELEKQIQSLSYYILQTPPSNLRDLIQGTPIIVLFQLQLERIMENLYCQFGISNQIRRIKHLNSNSCLVVGPVQVEYWMSKKQEQFDRQTRPQFPKLKMTQIKLIQRFQDKNQVIQYEGNRYFAKRYQKPLQQNILNQLKVNHPVLPRYFYYYEKQNCFYLIRHYYYRQFYPYYLDCSQLEQLDWLQSLGQILIDLHKNHIVIGKPFKDYMYLQGQSLVIDCKDRGVMQIDIQEYKQMIKSFIGKFKCLDKTEQILIQQVKFQLVKQSGLIKLVESLYSLKKLFL